MSVEANNEWEFSKENIQPNQQVKRSKMLKGALSLHTEEVTLQQQAYENKLCSYTGGDPLSVWNEYIKWVEQNFPRGSREKQTKELIERCILELSSEKKYFNDDRFVSIMIKYAILSCKTKDVYKYMYSNDIGYKSAKFYISWSREEEKLGMFKQAEEILVEGLKHTAEPFDKLQSYYENFQLRLSAKIKENSERLLFESKTSQSSNVMTPQMKRFAPNSMYREGLVESSEILPFIEKQPHQKSITTSVKVPFKIHDSENINTSVQLTVSGSMNFGSSSENDQKLSKLNIGQPLNHQFKKPNVTKQAFDLHCDAQNDENSHTPRSVPKVSNILKSDSEPFCPPVALFEPPDPLKKPMYPKSKVYTETEEFSLEEIRAAEWLDKKKKKEQEVLLIEQQKIIEKHEKTEEELKKQVEYLAKQVELLQSQLRLSNINSCNVPDSNVSNSNNSINSLSINPKFHNNSCIEKSVIEKNSSMYGNSILSEKFSDSRQGTNNDILIQNNHCNRSNLPNFLDNNADLTGLTEAAKMVQEMFNKTLSHHDVFDEGRQPPNKDLSGKSSLVPSMSDSSENFQPDEQNFNLKQPRGNLPFSFYCDPTATITSLKTFDPIIESDKTDNFSGVIAEGDVENIPPKGYTQDKTKRELAGILQASKNILFIPLSEQQEESDDDCSDMEDSEVCPNQMQFSDDTLIPPSNTEQFSTAKFLSSTPFVPRNNSPSIEISDNKIVPLEEDSTVNHLSSAGCQYSAKKELENDQANSELKSFNDQSCAPRLSKVLSVIMETSREAYSKSSSSSSSSLTRSNNLDQLSSHRVSLFKPYSKFEPSALSCVSEIQNGIPDMACEKNSGIFPTEEHNNFLIHITNTDPFDQEVNQSFLNSVSISSYKNLFYIKKTLKGPKSGEIISIGQRSFQLVSLVAEGAYAKVFEANDCALIASGNGQRFALKVCKNCNEWEFYICCELQKRFEKTFLRNSVMQCISAGKYSNAIVLVTEFGKLGTLLDVINYYKKEKPGMPELVVMYFTREILLIVSKLHKCNILHGDVKPDNFLLANDSFEINALNKMETSTSLQLIDFGRAIDLNFYSKGVCFTSVFDKAHFKCNEMKENNPWVFQLDWYGVASCIHTMLFSDYMTVKKKGNVWEIEKKLKRYWCTSLWESIFNDLLNIPQCYQELNIESHVSKIEQKLQQNSDKFLSQFYRLAKFYTTEK